MFIFWLNWLNDSFRRLDKISKTGKMFSPFQSAIHAPPPPPPPQPPLTTQTQYRLEFQKLNNRITMQDPVTNKQQTNQSVNQIQTILPFLRGKVNSTAYASALDSCTCPKFGKQVHAHVLKNGFHGREFVQTKLLKFYGKCGYVDDLVQVFGKMPERNSYTYTTVLNGLLDNGLFEEALMYFERLLFEDMMLDFFVFPVALKICNGYGGIELGRQLHGISMKIGVLSHNNYVGNALIDMYGKCGSLSDAEKVFDKMSERDCVSWNSMVTARAANGRIFEALDTLEEMSRDNELTPNFVTWSALIGGFTQNGYDEEAIETLHKMRATGFEPNSRILASVLPACARLREQRLGKEMHGYITRHGFMSSPYIVNGLIDLYRRCGVMESAYKVFSKSSVRYEVSFNTMIAGYCENGEILKAKELFDMMEYEKISRDLISWNSMISGYADNFMFDEALRLFIDLISTEEIEPDSFTLGSVLNTCAAIGCLKLGKGVHSLCIVKRLQSNPFIGGALVDMYCQCRDLELSRAGKLKRAHKMIEEMPVKPDSVAWGALLGGCIIHGDVDLGDIVKSSVL